MNLTITTNAAGLITDEFLTDDLSSLMKPEIGIDTVYLFAHGWQTTMSEFAVDQNRFSAGIIPALIARQIEAASASRNSPLTLGIHWPSTLTEDDDNPLKCFDALTFYSCEHRADVIGDNAGFAILAKIIDLAQRPLKFILIGHSFGCKVVCQSLSKLAQYSTIPDGTTFTACLLQPAFESNDLGPEGDYWPVSMLSIRIVVTHSKLDLALNDLFPKASIVNILASNHVRTALGGVGPDTETVGAWGERMLSLDISPWQTPMPPPSGNHSDVFGQPLLNKLAEIITSPAVVFPFTN